MAHASIMSVMKHGRYSNIEIDSALKNAADLSDADRGLYTRLVYGVIERQLTLDHVIAQFSSRKLSDIDLPALTSLRLGFYQLIYTDRIPEFAAVSETVDTAPSRSKGFVNGVLRSFLRAGKSFTLPEGNSPEELSICYSTAVDICRVFLESYGAEETRRILEAFFVPDRICLRINTLKITVPDAMERLGCGVIGSYCDDVIRVTSVDKTVRDGIAEGLWFVQDEASRICTKVLSATAGDVIADTCAAPGGKSLSASIDAGGKCETHSFDLHKNKLSLINSAAEKLGLDCITTECRDARKPDPALIGKCDRVLCDAPCSGLGVLAKKPDIRYKDDECVGRLPEIQYDVLCGAAEYVKSGGVLVYSTCTLNKRENEEIVTKFLESHSEFSFDDFTVTPTGNMPVLVSKNGMLTLFPHVSDTDGFFVARLIKNN